MNVAPGNGPASAAARSPSPMGRGLASVAILTYLAAVIAPPLAGPPPASALSRVLLQPLRPLVGLLHLGHGYRFFAPNPGPGHAIRWTLARPDGTTESGSIPDPVRDRPRLLYHRRFMVSEKIAAFVPLPDEPPEVQEAAKRDWGPLVRHVAHHLLEIHGEGRLTLELVEHFLPGPEDVLGGLVEPDFVTPLGTYESRPIASRGPNPDRTAGRAVPGIAAAAAGPATFAAGSRAGPGEAGR